VTGVDTKYYAVAFKHDDGSLLIVFGPVENEAGRTTADAYAKQYAQKGSAYMVLEMHVLNSWIG
jgi:hypothetical protein